MSKSRRVPLTHFAITVSCVEVPRNDADCIMHYLELHVSPSKVPFPFHATKHPLLDGEVLPNFVDNERNISAD